MKPHTVHHSADGLRTAQQSLSNKKHNSNRDFFSFSLVLLCQMDPQWSLCGCCATILPQSFDSLKCLLFELSTFILLHLMCTSMPQPSSSSNIRYLPSSHRTKKPKLTNGILASTNPTLIIIIRALQIQLIFLFLVNKLNYIRIRKHLPIHILWCDCC